jgi:hypothetical protein
MTDHRPESPSASPPDSRPLVAAEPGPPEADAVPADPDALPPDPAAYDSERNALARARGLAAPYIAGGRDPDPASGHREERYYGRLLLLMVAAIVLGGFVLGIITNLVGALGG